MKYYISFMATSILLLSVTGCSKDDADAQKIKPINPQVQAIGQAANYDFYGNIRAWIYDENTIKGFGGSYYFETSNLFETVDVEDGQKIAQLEILVKDGETLLYQNKQEIQRKRPLYADDVIIKQFTDNGKNNSTYVEIPGFDYDPNYNYNDNKVGSHYYADPCFLDKNTGWIVSRYVNTASHINTKKNGLKVFSIVNGNVTLISAPEFENLQPHAIHFQDNQNGWILAKSHGTQEESDEDDMYILRTVDGGLTWSNPLKVLDGDDVNFGVNRIYTSSGDNILLYADYGGVNNMVHSSNSGLNWNHVSIGTQVKQIKDIDFPSENIGYLVVSIENNYHTENAIYKSTNGGLSWLPHNIEEKEISGIDFFTDDIGINFYKGVLKITKDGGKTWNSLIHP